MKESPYLLDIKENVNALDLKEILFKYLKYWPWFLVSAIFALTMGYLYTRYAPKIYESEAKIEIVEESKQMDIAVDPTARQSSISTINLENDIAKIKSYRILHQVAEALDLNISYFKKDNLKTTEIWNPPFTISKLMVLDSLQSDLEFKIRLNLSGAWVTDMNEKLTVVQFKQQDSISNSGLPFRINIQKNLQPTDYENIDFWVGLRPIKETVLDLAKDLKVEALNKQSEILSLSLEGQSAERSEAILNEIINKFNQDGVVDRQLTSKRTLEFIDERFLYLSGELDSIEVDKKDFKQNNSLSNIQSDTDISLQRKMITQDEVTKFETQVSLSDLLKDAVKTQMDYGLLPVDIGLENSGINSLVSDYNQMAIERDRLMTSVGSYHPTLVNISSQLERLKLNILNTLDIYQTQLKHSLNQLIQEKSQAGYSFARLPEKEKMLRSIERQQSIKENLYLILLQKREEAEINYAVTAPSIKVVDYAVTNNKPISPQKKIVYPVSLAIGLFLPFLALFIQFSLDTKVRSLADLEKVNSDIPLLCEIPFIKDKKRFETTNDRSILAESFRIMSNNINYLLPEKATDVGQIVFVTSAITGEGKTLMALNLSLAFASMEKRVLLVGADLRNPQLHTYFDISKDIIGLADFLADPKIEFQNCIHEGFGKSTYHKVCLSGGIPPNAPVLLSSERFEKFMEIARKEFDYIVIDTSPTILVSDTLLISKYADVSVFVVRAGFTDKKLLEFSKDLNSGQKLQNMAYILNAVGDGKSKDYNYGYGYGYDTTKSSKAWYKFSIKNRNIKIL